MVAERFIKRKDSQSKGFKKLDNEIVIIDRKMPFIFEVGNKNNPHEIRSCDIPSGRYQRACLRNECMSVREKNAKF